MTLIDSPTWFFRREITFSVQCDSGYNEQNADGLRNTRYLAQNDNPDDGG